MTTCGLKILVSGVRFTAWALGKQHKTSDRNHVQGVPGRGRWYTQSSLTGTAEGHGGRDG